MDKRTKKLITTFLISILTTNISYTKTVFAEESRDTKALSKNLENDIKIGVCFALSGEGAKWSASHLNGILMAEEDWKAKGVNLKVIIEDTGTVPAGTVKCFKKMTEVEHVDAVVGNIFGFLTSPIMPLAKQKKIPVITSSLSKYGCPKDNDYVYSVSEQVYDITDTIYEKFFKKHPDVKTASILAFDDVEWGNVNAKAVQVAAERSGVKILDVEFNQEYKPDLRSIYPKMLAKNPDVIFIYHEPLSTVKVLRELQYKGKIVHSNAIGEQIWDTNKADPIFEGVYYTDINLNETFTKRFKDKFNKLPVLEPHSGYDAVNVVVNALLENRDNPASVLKTKKFEGINGGVIDFSKSCAGKVSSWGFYKIEGGVPVVE